MLKLNSSNKKPTKQKTTMNTEIKQTTTMNQRAKQILNCRHIALGHNAIDYLTNMEFDKVKDFFSWFIGFDLQTASQETMLRVLKEYSGLPKSIVKQVLPRLEEKWEINFQSNGSKMGYDEFAFTNVLQYGDPFWTAANNIVSWAHNTLHNTTLLISGFYKIDYEGLVIWVKEGSKSERKVPPVLVFPGLGGGFAMATWFLYLIQKEHPNADFYIIETPITNLRERSIENYMLPEQVADRLYMFLLQNHFSKIKIIAHSYGTLIAGVFSQLHSEMIEQMILIEPMCFVELLAICHRDYRNIVHKGGFLTPFRLMTRDLLLLKIVSDIRLWNSCIFVMSEELQKRVTVYCSKNDIISDTEALTYVLTQNFGHIEQIHFKGTHHGLWLFIPEDIISISRKLQK
jgi:pimeloyl-ACP methyl ester carboxylesterase